MFSRYEFEGKVFVSPDENARLSAEAQQFTTLEEADGRVREILVVWMRDLLTKAVEIEDLMEPTQYWITYTAPHSDGRVGRHAGPYATHAEAQANYDDIAGYEMIEDVKIVTEDPTAPQPQSRYEVLQANDDL